jgi:hypothetical protein
MLTGGMQFSSPDLIRRELADSETCPFGSGYERRHFHCWVAFVRWYCGDIISRPNFDHSLVRGALDWGNKRRLPVTNEYRFSFRCVPSDYTSHDSLPFKLLRILELEFFPSLRVCQRLPARDGDNTTVDAGWPRGIPGQPSSRTNLLLPFPY